MQMEDLAFFTPGTNKISQIKIIHKNCWIVQSVTGYISGSENSIKKMYPELNVFFFNLILNEWCIGTFFYLDMY